jgi:hypothetical protein
LVPSPALQRKKKNVRRDILQIIATCTYNTVVLIIYIVYVSFELL